MREWILQTLARHEAQARPVVSSGADAFVAKLYELEDFMVAVEWCLKRE